MQRFRVDLKMFLSSAMPNQYSQTVRKQISSWFWGNNVEPKSEWPLDKKYLKGHISARIKDIKL